MRAADLWRICEGRRPGCEAPGPGYRWVRCLYLSTFPTTLNRPVGFRSWEDRIAHEPRFLQRRYSADAVGNRRLFERGGEPDEQVARLWEWIDRATRLAVSGARSSGGHESSPLRTSDAGAVTVLAVRDGGAARSSSTGAARAETKRGFRMYLRVPY